MRGIEILFTLKMFLIRMPYDDLQIKQKNYQKKRYNRNKKAEDKCWRNQFHFDLDIKFLNHQPDDDCVNSMHFWDSLPQ